MSVIKTTLDISEAVLQLSALSAIDYELMRKGEAEKLAIRPSVLDKLVEGARSKQKITNDSPFNDIEPFSEKILPAELFAEIADTVQKFIVLEPYQANGIALWISFSWFIGEVNIAPLLVITAPEKSCGKTQLLDLIGRLVARPLPAANSTPAALFRSVEKWSPTLLIDEADTFIKGSDELIGLINAGHSRSNAFVLRVVGDDHEPKSFRVWGAKALAGIALERHLPDATMSRSIVIEMRRKLAGEQVQRLRHSQLDAAILKAKLARFSADFSETVRNAKVTLPETLSDREQDNWEPLVSIAKCAGEEWVERAIEAALKISASNIGTANDSGNELLADIREAFDVLATDKLSTLKLINALLLDEERPWATYNRGKPITPRQVAKRLASYGITSKTLREGYLTFKGYEKKQFDDAFNRYLPEEEKDLSQSDNVPDSSVVAESDVTDSGSVTVTLESKVTPFPAPLAQCDAVTLFLKKPIQKCEG